MSVACILDAQAVGGTVYFAMQRMNQDAPAFTRCVSVQYLLNGYFYFWIRKRR